MENSEDGLLRWTLTSSSSIRNMSHAHPTTCCRFLLIKTRKFFIFHVSNRDALSLALRSSYGTNPVGGIRSSSQLGTTLPFVVRASSSWPSFQFRVTSNEETQPRASFGPGITRCNSTFVFENLNNGQPIIDKCCAFLPTFLAMIIFKRQSWLSKMTHQLIAQIQKAAVSILYTCRWIKQKFCCWLASVSL